VTGPAISHEDVAGYPLRSLTPEEEAAFEQQLADCAWCRRQVGELSAPAELLRPAVPAYDMPPDFEVTTLAAVERGASENGVPPSPPARRVLRPRRLAFAAAAIAAGALVIVPRLDRPVDGVQVELEAVLVPPTGGPERATAVVEKDGNRAGSVVSERRPADPPAGGVLRALVLRAG
jgi:anti-sigma factor RsiW